ncbi:hypothetical protein DDB_G0290999 [Dictyostelium discoideum AX4]|uniref:Uncharacterized protein n=1 Tax=Dictyostelium discoideum TaxID=44689 RepID=Q54F92_DICDI|nr:hypothetical protein DDB_G0290999 [Dictyostelium discoideum AX4]EAL61930.1 hypothetical protein DDB_G0290999 [Dictyostelium discoideum AX4]|eukprot:XP_635445.1 hypothetical protein DDB_G0290999 [Dictyostelium discoideum AX4]
MNNLNKNKNKDIYSLYKSVFNNKYLSNYIYDYVYKFNEQISYGGRSYSEDCFKIKKYDQAGFEWCLKHARELLLYKIKRNEKFDQIDSKSITSFIYFFNNNYYNHYNLSLNKEESSIILNQLLNTNKSILLSTNKLTQELIKTSLDTSNLDLLKFIFENYGTVNPSSTSSSSTSSSTSTSATTKTTTTTTTTTIEELRINNDDLFDKSLGKCDLKIIKFIYYELGIMVKDPMKAFYNALCSNKRCELIRFLLDEIGFVPPISFTGSFEIYFENLMRLDHQLFKRLYNDYNIPLLQFNGYNSFSVLNNIFLSYNLLDNYLDHYGSGCANYSTIASYLDFNYGRCIDKSHKTKSVLEKYQIDYILTALLVLSVSHRTSKKEKQISSLLFKKVEHLIEYNENRNIQTPFKHILKKTDILKENQTTKKVNSIYNLAIIKPTPTTPTTPPPPPPPPPPPTANDKIVYLIYDAVSYIYSFFNNNNNNTIKNNNVENEEEDENEEYIYFDETEFTEIDYEDFELVREIKRVFYFDWFAKSEKGFYNYDLESLIYQFISEYKEYDLIKTYPPSCSSGGDNLVRVACYYGDCELLKMNKDHKIKIDGQPLFNHDRVDIKTQLEFLKIAITNTNFTNPMLISHIINPKNTQFKIKKHANRLANIINSNQRRFSAHCLLNNKKLFKYYFENHKSLFTWDSDDISKSVVRDICYNNHNNNKGDNGNGGGSGSGSGDIQFLQYLFDNGIGDINDDLLSDCIDITTIKYMVKYFSLKLKAKFIYNYSYIDLWKSNYLTFYLINNVDFKNELEFIQPVRFQDLDHKTAVFLYLKLKSQNIQMDYKPMENYFFSLKNIIERSYPLLVVKLLLDDFENNDTIDQDIKSKFNLTISQKNYTTLCNKINQFNRYKDFIQDKVDRNIIKIVSNTNKYK